MSETQFYLVEAHPYQHKEKQKHKVEPNPPFSLTLSPSDTNHSKPFLSLFTLDQEKAKFL